MSAASKCDRCGAMYPPSKGSAYIEAIGYDEQGESEFTTWGEIELCPPCTTLVFQAIGDAIENNPVSR